MHGSLAPDLRECKMCLRNSKKLIQQFNKIFWNPNFLVYCDDTYSKYTNITMLQFNKIYLLLNLIFLIGIDSNWTNPPQVSFDANSPQQLNILTQNRFTLTATAIDNEPVIFNWSFQSIPTELNGNSPQLSIIPLSTTQQRVEFQIDQEGQYILQLIVDDQDGDPLTQTSQVMVIDAVLSQTFFVSNSGDDNTSLGTISIDTPLRTIDKAMSLSGPGDTIILLTDSVSTPAPTTFLVNTINFTVTGTSSNPLNIRGSNPSLITIKPTGSNTGFRIIDRTNINISDLIFEGFSLAAISLTTVSDIIIDSCKFHQNNIAISIEQSEDTTLNANLIYNNNTGVQISESNNIALRNSYIYRNSDYGYRILSQSQTSVNNIVHSNSFYDNGTIYDETIKNAAINMGNNDQNLVQFNLIVNNIKDYFQDSGIFQTELNSNLSFLNIGIQREEAFLPPNVAADWLLVDPLLKDPENADFRLLEGSPALSRVVINDGNLVNIGAFQGTPASNILTRTIFVDFDQASNSLIQNGQSGTPYDSINKALLDANPGDTIDVIASQQKDYTIDFNNLQSDVPGWGTVKIKGRDKIINGLNVPPKLSCFQTNGNVVEIISRRHLMINNFMFTGFKTNNNIEVPDQCLNGGYIRDSRHIELSDIVSHGMFNAGIVVDSSEHINIQSTVLHDNTIAMELNSNISRNQFNYFNKFTISNNLNGISIQNSYSTTIINSIFYDNSNCLTSDPFNPPTDLKVKYSLCHQSGVISNFLLDSLSSNKTGFGTAFNPFFISENSTYQKTNPWEAFLLKATNTTISPALNAGQLDYPKHLVLKEFNLPLETIPPISNTKELTGVIDMGAFEQSRTDVDGDGINNVIDGTLGLDPNNPDDANADFDNDTLTNLFELSSSPTTDINSSDTDNDGFSDGVEVGIGSDPTVDDSSFIISQVPKPLIMPHTTDVPPSVFNLSGVELNGKAVKNKWILLSAPIGIDESDIFLNETSQDLTVQATLPGQYVIGLDQQLIPDVSGTIPLGSLEEDRSITTITIQDVPPTPILAPPVTVSYAPGRVIYFYGSPDIIENPSFDSNGAPIISYEWIQTSPKSSEPNLISVANPTPSMVVPNRSAIYQWKLKVRSSGPSGIQSTISEDSIKIQVQGNQYSLPIAQAGEDSFVMTQNINQLNGSGSGDKENTNLKYYWRQIKGSPVQFVDSSICSLDIFEPSSLATDTTTCTTTQISQYFSSFAGVVEFELVVSKNFGGSDHFSQPDKVTHIIDSPANAVPQAVASAPDIGFKNTIITLDGSSSADRPAALGAGISSNLNFHWKQISGPSVYLETTTISHLQFTPIVEGFYTFSLEVEDSEGVVSKPKIIQLRVDRQDFFLPSADAGKDQIGLVNRTILLDASSSTGGSSQLVNYFWKQIGGPETVNLTNSNASSTSFSPSKGGLFTFSLIVATDKFYSFEDIVTVAVNSDTQFVPVAIASDNQIQPQSSVITLDGTRSFDQDGDPLTYFWQQISGIPIILSNQNSPVTTFFASSTGFYEFSLVVRDGKSSSNASVTLVSITKDDGTNSNQNNSFVPFDPTFIPGPSQTGGCFILSASFGKDSVITKSFIYLRDHFLMKIPWGSKLIQNYYLYSPPIAELIENQLFLKWLFRLLLGLILISVLFLPILMSVLLIGCSKHLIKTI